MDDIKKGNNFFKNFIIGLGFLQGIWFAMGINPSAKIFEGVQGLINYINPSLKFSFVFSVLPIIILVIGIILIYREASIFGIFASILGFIAGTMILVSPTYSVILLALSWLLGWSGVNIKKRKDKNKQFNI